jgi:predicted RNase H-like HicB family nuclease
MDRYLVELEPTDTGGFALTAPALPGLLILGQSTDEVLDRARPAIQFHTREKQTRPGQAEMALSPLSRDGTR